MTTTGNQRMDEVEEKLVGSEKLPVFTLTWLKVHIRCFRHAGSAGRYLFSPAEQQGRLYITTLPLQALGFGSIPRFAHPCSSCSGRTARFCSHTTPLCNPVIRANWSSLRAASSSTESVMADLASSLRGGSSDNYSSCHAGPVNRV